MRPRCQLIPFIVAVVVTLVGPVRAEQIAIGFDNETVGVTSGGGNLYGWQFHTSSTLRVLRLGLWDGRSPYEGGVFGDGLSGSHEIAIWQVDRPLSPLVSSLVPAGTGAPLVSGFRYISISPVTLLAGRDYVIGAEYHDGQDPMARDLDNPRFTLTVSPEIEFGGYRWGPWEGALAFPGHYYPGSLGHFGPNFTFIPEPPPFALVLVAICAGAWRLRQA